MSQPTPAEILDDMAIRIFSAALLEHRAGELLNTLFEGGSATIDKDGKLLIYPVHLINQAWEEGSR